MTEGQFDPRKVQRSYQMEPHEAIQGLVQVCNYILLYIAASEMDENGQSSFLNSCITDVSKQQPDLLPENSKNMVLGMIAAVEETLRDITKRGPK